MVPEEHPLLRNACLVVAHPDDEILWFSSIVTRVARTYICYLGNPKRPALGRGRRAALGEPPLDGFVSLGLDEADVYDLARWPDPDPAPPGLALDKAGDAATQDRYGHNFARLTETLADHLAGFDVVFTHNPWGEYGHEEHVQVYRAVRQVRDRLGFRLWCSSYVGSRSQAFMARCLAGAGVKAITLDTDAGFARQVAQHYKANGVWTWFDDYVWPERESFLHFMPPGAGGHAPQPIPLNYLEMGRSPIPLADRTLRGLARTLRGRLPLAVPPATPLV